MRTKFKPWALPFLKEHSDIAYINFDSKNEFYDDTLNLEIGGGKGDFIISLALKNPNIHYLMIERVTSVAAPAVKKIIERNITNVKIIYDNFINVVKDIKDESVNNIFLNFSDPWPKKRHAKRRLTSPTFMDDYYRILKRNGLIIFKTDQKNLFEFSKKMIDTKKFELIYENNNYNILDEDDGMSEYEAKFRELGNTIYRLKLKKL